MYTLALKQNNKNINIIYISGKKSKMPTFFFSIFCMYTEKTMIFQYSFVHGFNPLSPVTNWNIMRIYIWGIIYGNYIWGTEIIWELHMGNFMWEFRKKVSPSDRPTGSRTVGLRVTFHPPILKMSSSLTTNRLSLSKLHFSLLSCNLSIFFTTKLL